jgi:hypothetical protein
MTAISKKLVYHTRSITYLYSSNALAKSYRTNQSKPLLHKLNFIASLQNILLQRMKSQETMRFKQELNLETVFRNQISQ